VHRPVSNVLSFSLSFFQRRARRLRGGSRRPAALQQQIGPRAESGSRQQVCRPQRLIKHSEKKKVNDGKKEEEEFYNAPTHSRLPASLRCCCCWIRLWRMSDDPCCCCIDLRFFLYHIHYTDISYVWWRCNSLVLFCSCLANWKLKDLVSLLTRFVWKNFLRLFDV
jgi:hypothetical protein